MIPARPTAMPVAPGHTRSLTILVMPVQPTRRAVARPVVVVRARRANMEQTVRNPSPRTVTQRTHARMAGHAWTVVLSSTTLVIVRLATTRATSAVRAPRVQRRPPTRLACRVPLASSRRAPTIPHAVRVERVRSSQVRVQPVVMHALPVPMRPRWVTTTQHRIRSTTSRPRLVT